MTQNTLNPTNKQSHFEYIPTFNETYFSVNCIRELMLKMMSKSDNTNRNRISTNIYRHVLLLQPPRVHGQQCLPAVHRWTVLRIIWFYNV